MKKFNTALHCWLKQLFWKTTLQKTLVCIFSIILIIISSWLFKLGWKNIRISFTHNAETVTEEIVSEGTFTTTKNIFLRDCEEFSYTHYRVKTMSGVYVYGKERTIGEAVQQGKITYIAYIGKNGIITFGSVNRYTKVKGIISWGIALAILYFLICIIYGAGTRVKKPVSSDSQKEETLL